MIVALYLRDNSPHYDGRDAQLVFACSIWAFYLPRIRRRIWHNSIHYFRLASRVVFACKEYPAQFRQKQAIGRWKGEERVWLSDGGVSSTKKEVQESRDRLPSLQEGVGEGGGPSWCSGVKGLSFCDPL